MPCLNYCHYIYKIFLAILSNKKILVMIAIFQQRCKPGTSRTVIEMGRYMPIYHIGTYFCS
jgi:hypothetical protein